MKEESIFLEIVGDTPRMRVLQYFIEGRESDFMLTDLIHAGVSWATLNRLAPRLLELNLIVVTRRIGRATLYKINKENEVALQLMKMYDGLIMKELQQMAKKQVIEPLTH